MVIKEFTKEQIEQLKFNKYVVAVNSQFVYFSTEFKERFYKEYQSGKKPKKVIVDMGLDPEILGQSRINGIKCHIMNNVRDGKEFTDVTKIPEAHVDGFIKTEDKIRRLEHELEYTRQELEFVKKIISAGQGESR